MTPEMKQAIAAAVFAAIKEIGLPEFKRTSMFLSNERKPK